MSPKNNLNIPCNVITTLSQGSVNDAIKLEIMIAFKILLEFFKRHVCMVKVLSTLKLEMVTSPFDILLDKSSQTKNTTCIL